MPDLAGLVRAADIRIGARPVEVCADEAVGVNGGPGAGLPVRHRGRLGCLLGRHDRQRRTGARFSGRTTAGFDGLRVALPRSPAARAG
jgi:hypothetical protein